MTRQRIHFLFLNLGHFFDHLFPLIFATVAALSLAREWDMGYGQLIPYATPGFIAFGVCSVGAGWLADKWSREGMLTVFFFGIGISSVATAMCETPVQLAVGLFAIGVFAAIYHPVGLAMIVEGRKKTGVPIAVNGIFGNMGVAGAALITGFLIDLWGWRWAFVVPGTVCIAAGIAYAAFVRSAGASGETEKEGGTATAPKASIRLDRSTVVRIFAIIFLSTTAGGLVFQSTTFALPKILDERLVDMAGSATAIGGFAFIVFAVAAFGQLVVGYFLDRFSLRLVFAFVAGLQAVFFLVLQHLSGPVVLAAAICLMLFVFGQIPINDVLIGRITTNQWRSRIYGVRYVLTFTVMASALPLIGWIHAAWGFATLFAVLAGAAGLILCSVLMLPRIAGITAGSEEKG